MNDDGRAGDRKAEDAIGDPAAEDRPGAKRAVDQALSTVQDGYGRARTKVREMLDGAPAVARDAVATGRDYYRRGTEAVTRNATDNTALTLLAAGVAVAALSWLVFGRRRKKDEA